MAQDSRLRSRLLCEVKVNSVAEMEPAKEEAHQKVGGGDGVERCGGRSEQEQNSPGQDEEPSEEFDPPLHEETGRVQGATVGRNPDGGKQPGCGRAVSAT